MVQQKIVTRDTDEREQDLDTLYTLLYRLKEEQDGFHTLAEATAKTGWPEQGVYFFFAPDKTREHRDQLRITRVGTHAVSTGSQTKLWDRLRQHRGPRTGQYADGGNHRGSVFRLHVGAAIIEQNNLHDQYPDWGNGSHADQATRETEHSLEQHVSEFIRSLPVLCVPVPGEAKPTNKRAVIEQNAIALLSNYGKPSLDERNTAWLGQDSPTEAIRASGLWNVNHVEEPYNPEFLHLLEEQITTGDA